MCISDSDEMVYSYASFQRLLQKYDRKTIYDQFEKKLQPSDPKKDAKLDSRSKNSLKRANFVSKW